MVREASRTLIVDEQEGCLWVAGTRATLPPKAWAVLNYLAKNSGRLVPKEELLEAVWPNVFVTDGVLKVCIRQIREAVGEDPKQPWLIDTVHRRGYRLFGPLEHRFPHVAQRGEIPGRAPIGEGAGEPSIDEPLVLDGADGVVGSADEAGDTIPVVGREDALRTIRGLWERAVSGERQLVFVTGEPGIGKSTLLSEFARHVRRDRRPVRVGIGQCLEKYGANEAYLPVLDAVEDLLRSCGEAQLAPVLRGCAPAFFALLGGGRGEAPSEAEAAPERVSSREGMLREVAAAIEALAEDVPALLILEDVHWSDPSTVALLAVLAQRRSRARLLVACTYRPGDLLAAHHPLMEIQQTLASRDRCLEIPLGLLSEADVREYLEAVTGVAADAPTARLLRERTGGNPLFLASVVPRRDAAAIANSAASGWGDLPDGLRAAIARRLESVAQADFGVLLAASVVGLEFASAAAAAVVGRTPDEAEDVCERIAQRGDVLRSCGVMRIGEDRISGRYAFVHAVYREVLYDRIGEARRMAMHQRLAAWGEAHGWSPGNLAFHFARCGTDAQARRAVEFGLRAAARATAVFAHDEAIEFCRTAVAVARAMAVRDARVEAEAQVSLAESLQRAGRYNEADEGFREGVAMARDVGDARLLARAAIGLGHSYQRIGAPDESLITLLQESLTAMGGEEDSLVAELLAHLDYALCSRGGSEVQRYGLGERACAIARRCGDPAARVRVLQYTEWAMREPRTDEDWRRVLVEARSLLPEVADAEQETALRYIAGTTLLEMGDTAGAAECFEEMSQRAAQSGMPWCMWLASRLTTALALFEGRFEGADERIAACLRIGQRTDHPNLLQMFGAQSALFAIEQGRFAEALFFVEAAVEANPEVATWRAAAAFLISHLGDEARGRELLAEVTGHLVSIPQDTTWLLALSLAAAAAERVGSREAAAAIYPLLEPYRGRFGFASSILSLGSVERYVGLAALAAERSEAVDHLRCAVASNERAGARPWAVLCRFDLARALARAGSPSEAARLQAAAEGEAQALGMVGWIVPRRD